MAITENTRENIILGVGDFYVGADDMGATSREGSFAVEQELYWPELGGTKGRVKGTGTIISENATLTVNLKEVSIANLVRVLPTLASGSNGTSEYTTRTTFGFVGADAHQDVHWAGQTMDGKEIEIYLYDALPEGSVEMNLSDDGEVTYAITFRAYYDPKNPAKRCWAIYTEK